MEIALGVVTDGALFRGGGADDYVAAVAALPDCVAVFAEDLLVLDVGQQLAVALFVVLFYGAYHFEFIGNFVEALLARLLCHARVHVCPLCMLPSGCVFQVVDGARHGASMQVLKPDLGVFLLVGGRFLEEVGYLYEAVLFGLAGVIRVFVPGLGFAREGLFKGI